MTREEQKAEIVAEALEHDGDRFFIELLAAELIRKGDILEMAGAGQVRKVGAGGNAPVIGEAVHNAAVGEPCWIWVAGAKYDNSRFREMTQEEKAERVADALSRDAGTGYFYTMDDLSPGDQVAWVPGSTMTITKRAPGEPLYGLALHAAR